MSHSVELPFVAPDESIHQVLRVIDGCAKGIGIVVDSERFLLGTITDGDIRRMILAGVSLKVLASDVLAAKSTPSSRRPVTASIHSSQAALLGLMKENGVRQVPLLDDAGRVAGLVTLDELVPTAVLPLRAVIMAGGSGTRLLPLTAEVPKPMLPIGDKPLLEWTVAHLREAGIRRVQITTHYKPEIIAAHFGDGEAFGVRIDYVPEHQPLGTAGALGLPDVPRERMLLINGDILTRMDIRSMLAYHEEQHSDLTVAVRGYQLQIPYGIVECEGPRVLRIQEKPSLKFFVNAGIYVLEPCVHDYISPGERLDMPDLIQRMVGNSRQVISFPVIEYWLDIGQPADYEQAQVDIMEGLK